MFVSMSRCSPALYSQRHIEGSIVWRFCREMLGLRPRLLYVLVLMILLIDTCVTILRAASCYHDLLLLLLTLLPLLYCYTTPTKEQLVELLDRMHTPDERLLVVLTCCVRLTDAVEADDQGLFKDLEGSVDALNLKRSV